MGFVIYTRVSTKKQGASGLGLEAQLAICRDFIARSGGEEVAHFKDVESGTHRDRPGLWAAIDYCKSNSCELVIAKLDRLARDVEFTFKVIRTGIQIHFCDMPIMNTMVLGVFASVAQYERELCSGRTKSALKEIKDEIRENGGHMSQSGRWIRHLGRKKGVRMPGIGRGAGLAATRMADDWRSSSPLYKWVARQIKKNRPRKDIIEEAVALYESDPKVFCTREGKPLCKGTLSRWVKEMRLGM